MIVSMLPLVAVLLMSKVPNPAPSVDDLRGRYTAVAAWTLIAGSAARLQAPTNGPLPEKEFQRSELDPKPPADLLVDLKWKQKPRSDSILELDLDDGFAGGRLLAWRVPGGLMVERLTFGSGVYVAAGQRLELVPSNQSGRH
jgi:hypothetical protein